MKKDIFKIQEQNLTEEFVKINNDLRANIWAAGGCSNEFKNSLLDEVGSTLKILSLTISWDSED